MKTMQIDDFMGKLVEISGHVFKIVEISGPLGSFVTLQNSAGQKRQFESDDFLSWEPKVISQNSDQLH